MSKRRTNLLTESEIHDLYSLPKFNILERQQYFDLNKDEMIFTPFSGQ